MVAGSTFAGEKLTGLAYVTRVKDGDTLVARLDGGRTITVRLWGIDTPEHDQPWGKAATEALGALAKNPLSLTCSSKDRSGRWVCRIHNKLGADINLALVEQGHAWWYQQYAKKAMDLRSAEFEAREQRIGLWHAENPIPPWEWRRAKN